MSLVGAELERHGISTVAIALLRDVAEKVQPPRALSVPFRHGFLLDRPNDPARQTAVLEAMLRTLGDGAQGLQSSLSADPRLAPA